MKETTTVKTDTSTQTGRLLGRLPYYERRDITNIQVQEIIEKQRKGKQLTQEEVQKIREIARCSGASVIFP